MYWYRKIALDMYLQAIPGGYPGMELFSLIGGIIESRETQGGMWSPASKFGFC
jgi:hypothetical protein